MAAARIKRDEFIKRVTESRSEEYLNPATNDDDLSKSHSHVDLGPSQPSTSDSKKREISATTSEDVIELTVPTLSPTASIKSRADVLTSSFKEQPDTGVKRNQHRNLLKQAYQSLLSAILDPIAYLREKHNFEPKVA